METMIQSENLVICPKCNSSKKKECFFRNQKRKTGCSVYCKSCAKEYNKNHYIKHRKRWIDRSTKWRQENKEKVRAYQKIKRSSTQAKRAEVLRMRARCTLRTKNSNIFSPTLGCTGNEFKAYISSQFKNGMNFDNYGKIWNIDHIKPIKTFDLTDPEQYKAAAHYTNCRPVFVEDHNNFCHPGFSEEENPWLQKYAR